MHEIFNEHHSIKLKLVDDKQIYIENYKNIKVVLTNQISIDHYHIIGNNLNIISLDKYLVIIEGVIDSIEILRESK